MSVEAVLCLWIVGVGFLVAELFVPGMVMGAVGAVIVLVSIVTMFISGGAAWGSGLTVASIVLSGLIIRFAVGRMTHRHTLTSEDGYSGTDDRSDLVGREGVTATVLRPGGFANIDGQRIDVVTGGEMVEAGTPVVVVAVEGNRIQVRAKQA